jgi:hypothetical protein
MRGGGNRRDIRPIRPDGRFGDEALGIHRGDCESFNVVNAQAGDHYYHGKRKRRSIARLLRIGFRVVTEDDPERLEESRNPDFAAAGLDGNVGFGDTVLMKIPQSVYKRWKERKTREQEDRQRSAAEGHEFLDKGAQLRERFGEGNRDIHVQFPDHRVTRE